MLRHTVLWLLVAGARAALLYNDEPRLETVNGNLFIVAAKDRNITLSASPGGYITINGRDVQEVVNSALGAVSRVNAKVAGISTLQEDVRALQVADTELRTQIAICYGIISNGSVSQGSPLPPSATLNSLTSRLTKLERNLKKNECSRRPCMNGGSCLDLYMKFKCLCPSGWEGRRCQKDVNECSDLMGTGDGCLNGATCQNTPGSYECVCAPGFFGRHCASLGNNCSSASSQEMCDHGFCVPDGSGIKCICEQGWTKAPGQKMCSQDVDECLTSPCSSTPKVKCINMPGSFQCESCPPGYTGNGHSCEDINECAENNGGCSVVPLVGCRNTIGSFKCGPCPPGYSGDGVTCEFVGRCRADNGGCHPQATCQEIGSGIQCNCLPGYLGLGIGPNGCLASSLAPTNNHPCSPSPCVNGQCVLTSQYNYTCQCYVGFTGARCEISRNPCAAVECANGGTCVPRGKSFRCQCTKFYSGPLCTIERSDCGGFFSADTGVLEFPSSSVRYRPNLNCPWRISVNSSLVIQIIFDEFDLEPAKKDDCTSDWLQIYDGKEVGSHHMIGKFCGSNKPLNGTFISSSNNVLLWFKSNTISNHMGFKLHWNATAPQCGGDLNALVHGVFSSPGAPGKYPQNRDCYWKVTAAIGQRITFTFFSLNIEQHPDCSFDYIEFFDGGTVDSPLISRYCTSGTPAPLLTPGRVAYVHFHSDNVSSDRGFQISYSPTPGVPGCGGVFTDAEGEIHPVRFDGVYRRNMDCVWLIRANPEQRVKITFESLDIERHSSACEHDFLEVRHGIDETAPLAGRFCGNLIPPPIVSQGSDLLIRFKTDGSISKDGFLIRYKEECGGTFKALTGMIKSPRYPRKYPDNINCIYLIDLPPGRAVRLDFLDFSVEAEARRSSRCFLDYVDIHDGLDENALSLGRYCGNVRPSTIIATHNKLYLRFRTDVSISKTGWIANYSSVDITCGGVHNELSGVISSPRSGDGYPLDTVCNWVIQVPHGYVIQMTFNSFHLEGTATGSCSFDYLEISDGHTWGSAMRWTPRVAPRPNAPVRFCGNVIPGPITTVNNIAYLKFSSDSSRSGDGFQISYTAINESSACGGNIIAPSGVLKSPGYPNPYPDDRICTWIIKVPNGQQIRLTTEVMDLEQSDDCSYDSIEIHNGGSIHSPLVGKYCGQAKPPVIVSLSHVLLVRFTSDALRAGKGFLMRWDGSLTGCGGLITAPAGAIKSPNYPEPYGRLAQCTYTILVSQGSSIELIFVDLELELTDDCQDDYIEVLEGTKSYGRRCAKTQLQSIISTSNKLTIKFVSDFAVSGKGFHLTYRTNCNGSITGERGVIESPGFPNMYTAESSCMWNIIPEDGHRVNMTFTDFTVNSDDKCTTSYVKVDEIENGVDRPQPDYVGKYCNSVRPPMLTSSKLPLRVALVGQSAAFRIEWVSVGCGGTLTKPSGTLSTPEYPRHFPARSRCLWRIRVDPEHSIRIVFNDISFDPSENCIDNGLIVYKGPDETAPKQLQICPTQHDQVILESAGNTMTVVFYSLHSLSGKGFTATYSSIPSKCGGVLSGPKGAIHSPNYPMNYKAFDDCTWTISVPPKHRVNFTFSDFDLSQDEDGNCTKNYIEVYDGDGLNQTSLLKACGSRMPVKNSVLSSSNVVTVRLRAESEAKGFEAQYKMACGATILVNEPGVINIGNIEDSMNCTWLLIAPGADAHITATITRRNMARGDLFGDDCDWSGVEMFDGDNQNSSKISHICGGSATVVPYTSTGNVMLIHFYTSFQVANMMTIAYTSLSSACGGDLFSLDGNIASPGYPASYPPNVECVWTIASTPGNSLQISWKVFTIAFSDSCHTDYVEIRKGSSGGTLLGTFCGTSVASNLTSDNGFWIKFSSGPVQQRTDDTSYTFLMEYSYSLINELSGTSGVITNPLYPDVPAIFTRSDYKWRVTVPRGNQIKFTFTDLEVHPMCVISYVKLYDGYDETAPFVKWCGQMPKYPYYVSSNVAFLTMDSYRDLDGGSRFKTLWEAVPTVEIAPTVNTTSACGGEIALSPSKPTKEITNPGYPDKSNTISYDARCVWTIRAPQGFHLGYRIKDMQLHESRGCIFEYVETYDGGEDSKPLGRFCLNNETMDVTKAVEVGPVLTIVFQKMYFMTKPGFSIQVDMDQGGAIEARDGIIDTTWSPNVTVWRRWIQVKDFHDWVVHVGRGKRIRATFESFDVAAGADGQCHDKYVQLNNGHHSDSPLLGKGKWCGGKPTNIPLTTGDYMFVRIKAPWRTSSFRMRFEEVGVTCGGRLDINEDIKALAIKSPNYPNSPPPNVECIWVFQAQVGKTLQIDFMGRFDMKDTPNCDEEYVEVRDGGSFLSNSLGRFCERAPSSLVSTDNLLYVKYYTNTSQPHNGFNAKVSLTRCGGIIRGRSGVLRSPGYPVLPQNMDCTWTIETDNYRQMVLSITDLDMPPTNKYMSSNRAITYQDFGKYFWMREKTNCTMDNVLFIYEPAPLRASEAARRPRQFQRDSIGRLWVMDDPFDQKEDMLTVGCAKTPAKNVSTSGNIVHVRLITSDIFGPSRGFKLSFTSRNTECGGYLSTPNGIITSPYYPNEVPRPYYCRWTIVAPIGRRVKITFKDFDLSGNRMEQRVVLYEETLRANSMVLDKTSILESSYDSSSNSLSIAYSTTGFAGTAHKGFKIEYSTDLASVCGGVLTETSGMIEEPKNLTTFSCQWSLPALTAPNTSYVFALQDAHLSNGTSFNYCERQSVGLFVFSLQYDSISQFCGDTPNQVFALPFEEIGIRTTKSVFNAPLSFRLNYSISNCGGVIRSSQLPYTLTSPNYPQSYPRNTHCAWRIDAEDGEFFKITIQDLTVAYDGYLTINNGPDMNSPTLVGRFSGNNIADYVLISQTNSVFIQFHATSETSSRGFKILFESNHTACGGTLSDSGMLLQSPNYPNKYAPNTECEWELRSHWGGHVGLVFTDRFFLEDTPNCVNDSLKVYDYDLTIRDWKLIATKCGRQQPSPINSTSRVMKVVFRSNEALEGDGFVARWEKNCGGEIDVSSGVIRSPNYPRAYPNNLHCEYIIRGHGQIINVEFKAFSLESPMGTCKYDSVKIEELTPTPTTRGIYCGTNSPPQFTSHYDVKVTFDTDHYVQSSGFMFEFNIDRCGGVIDKSTAIRYNVGRSAPVYPCVWQINAPTDMIVALQISNFSLPFERTCENANLEVVNSDNSSYARLCGSPNVTLPFVSTGNTMQLILNRKYRTFSSYYFNAYVSFTYGPKQGCGGSLALGDNPDTISSPDVNRDGQYEEFLDCHWSVSAKDGYYIKAKVINMDINTCNSSSKCECDFLEFHDGVGPHDELMGKVCGQVAPEVIVTSSNKLWLRFHTDGSYSGRGFTVQLSSSLSSCGASTLIATHDVKELRFPLASTFPSALRCSWLIVAQNVTTSTLYPRTPPIHVHLLSWDTTASQDCADEYLSLEDYGKRDFKSNDLAVPSTQDIGYGGLVYNGRKDGPKALGYLMRNLQGKARYCGTGAGNDFYASSGIGILQFVSNSGGGGPPVNPKFKIEYSLSPCSREYLRSQGRIRNTQLRPNEMCTLKILAPSPNQTIALYFSSFTMPADCDKGYLRVADGPNPTTSKELLKTCGYLKPNPVFSSGPQLYITMFTSVVAYTDIDISYTTTNQGPGCGGEFYNFGGEFTSPQYPDNVRTPTVCSWTVTVPEGYNVAFRFSDFSIGPKSTCATDYIEFLDRDAAVTPLSQFCGGDEVANIVGNTGSMIVRYTRSVHNGGTGWSLTFAAVAPGTQLYNFSY